MPTLADYERDYWAPDREQVLAQMRAEQQAPAAPYMPQITPSPQDQYANFEQNYWAPDREAVLSQMQAQLPQAGGGGWGLGMGSGFYSPGGPVYGGGGGQPGGGYQPFNETALSQAWLSSGGRTPQDLARFLQENPHLAQGVQLVGSKKDKLQLPNGRVVDAVLASGLGGQGATWNVEGPGGGGGAGGSLGGRAPNPVPFNYEPFVAPTGLDYMNAPGYKERLALGTDAIQRSAAAKGTLLTGGTLKDLNDYAQTFASNEYGNVYNRALDAYKTNFETKFQPWKEGYNQAYQSWLGNYNAAQQDWQNQMLAQQQRYGQLMGTAQLGLQATGQQAGYGQNYANQLSSILGGYGQNASDLLTGGANAQAAGQVAGGNAYAGALNNAGNAANMALLWGSLYGNQPKTTTASNQDWMKQYGIA
jgi:hypothetical protein